MKRAIALFLLAAVIAVTIAATASSQGRRTDTARDPVCGITVVKNPELSYAYRGETYYFCSKADLDTFKKSPEKYVRK